MKHFANSTIYQPNTRYFGNASFALIHFSNKHTLSIYHSADTKHRVTDIVETPKRSLTVGFSEGSSHS